MCNLYSLGKGQDAIRALTKLWEDRTGNLPLLPAIFRDMPAPVVAKTPEGRVFTHMRWGMPSPVFVLKNRKTDTGVTNARNTKSSHWRHWLGVGHRCLVPFTGFCEYDVRNNKEPVWFAHDETRPLLFFGGIWTNWTSVRKLKEGETNNDLFAFLTTEANSVVAPVHPKAMPVILTTEEEREIWLQAPAEEALALQQPAPEEFLQVVARGVRKDGRPA